MTKSSFFLIIFKRVWKPKIVIYVVSIITNATNNK